MLALGPTWSVSRFIAELSALAGVHHRLLLISCCDPICSRPSLHVVRGTSWYLFFPHCTTQEKALRVYTVYTIPVWARWHRASTSLAGSWFWAFDRSHQSLLARFQLPTGRCFGIVLRWFCQRLGGCVEQSFSQLLNPFIPNCLGTPLGKVRERCGDPATGTRL